MRRVVTRALPDGRICSVYPFHVCLKGLEQAILCKDDEDYDAMVKVLCVAARRKNVIIIIYAVVSNHCHVAILAVNQKEADAYSEEIKKAYSMWFSRKYGSQKILKRIEVKAILLENDWHVRNALAYIPRNALDNCCNIDDYKWSGYRAMFRKSIVNGVALANLNTRDRRRTMHTMDRLDGVPWTLDSEGSLIPSSFCDHTYLEDAFCSDQSFFLKTIGGLNVADTRYQLEERPYAKVSDTELLNTAQEIAQEWFAKPIEVLSPEQKTRIASYLDHTRKTTPKQLSRVLGVPPERLEKLLRK